MFTVMLRCPRCGEAIPHPFMRLAVPSNLGSDPCPSCRAPLRFSPMVREFDLVALALFGVLVVGGYFLFMACEACRFLSDEFPTLAPRVAILVTCIFAWPFFTAVARRLYFAYQLRRERQGELLEVAEGEEHL